MGGVLRIGACLSLTGRYARFGRQAALGLRAWRSLAGDVELRLEDDRSDPAVISSGVQDLAIGCDLVLGPYSTQLARAAGRSMAELGGVLWNHGGSGDDVQTGFAGHVVSVLSPTSRYAERFVRRAAASGSGRLRIAVGRGSFGRQVAAGAEAEAWRLGLASERIGPDGTPPAGGGSRTWDLLCAGRFEEDVAWIARARALAEPPRVLCAVAAGVRAFGAAVPDPDGIYGIAQWSPGGGAAPALGPADADFHAAYALLAGEAPDYPAAQAAAAAVVATHCARTAGSAEPRALWSAAAGLATTTLFGDFGIDAATGAQRRHEMVLVRWASGRMEVAG